MYLFSLLNVLLSCCMLNEKKIDFIFPIAEQRDSMRSNIQLAIVMMWTRKMLNTLYSSSAAFLYESLLWGCSALHSGAVQDVFGYRCNQLPLIERFPQWLSGPSPPLSVAAGSPVVNRTGFKWCSDAQHFLFNFRHRWHKNAQSGWSLKTEKIRINNMYTLILLIQYGISFWHELELAYTLYYIS